MTYLASILIQGEYSLTSRAHLPNPQRFILLMTPCNLHRLRAKLTSLPAGMDKGYDDVDG